MIVATDVYYDDWGKAPARAAAAGFEDWVSEAATDDWVAEIMDPEPYCPGQFYKRELPCLLAVLDKIKEPIDCIIVDGHVWLDSGQPGLGHYLYHALGKKVPVVGVAKRSFKGGYATEVCRGGSNTPLYVTAIGMADSVAAAHVQSMHGPYRIPTLLKRVDHLSRGRT